MLIDISTIRTARAKPATLGGLLSGLAAMGLASMEPLLYVWLGLFIALGTVIQSSAGFGFGLVTIPLMLWLGIPLPQAIAISLMLALVQMCTNGYQLREHIQWRPSMVVIVGRLVSLPVGIWLLVLLADAGQIRVKQIIGGLILLVLAAQKLLRVKPRPQWGTFWGWLAGLAGGIMGGLAGMGGPPAVIWVMAHRWTNMQQRATLFVILASTTIVNFVVLAVVFGKMVMLGYLLAIAYVPLVLLSAAVGMRLGEKLSAEQLRAVADVMLIVLAISSVINPLLG